MSDRSSLNLNRDCPSQRFNLKLILKLPKRYALGKVLLSLVRLTDIELTFLGALTGGDSDRFNWGYIQITGTVLDLINANLYLEVLQVDIDVVEFDSDLLVHFINYDFCDLFR